MLEVLQRWMVPGVEVALITVVIYSLLSFFWNTRAMDLAIGLLAFVCLYGISNWLHLPVLEKLLFYFVNAAVIALLIIFQPELRLALSKLSVKGKRYREITAFDKFLESLAQSIYRLAEKRVGALVLLENQDSLEEYANRAVILNAQFSPELLETVFAPNTPLHDGAMIIRGTTVVSAATILPLADDSQLSKSMGTRHRAGLGVSQLTDALVIIVSEERGVVSIARDGILIKVKMDRFKGVIRSIFTPPKTTLQTGFDALEKWKRWTQE